jgi:hypothetical protein
MNERQAYALAHPLQGASTGLGPYRRVDAQPDGNLLVSVLAVDR